ncbi:MAG TPA: substrate-binding domain-containing protein, partial [Clostridia bacterium]|nr:substrate-binding domain-containing protein [Clostridia bacterium]
LIPGIDSDLYRNIISGVETVVGNKGFVVIFCQTRGDVEAEFNFIKLMKTRQVDGIIQVRSLLNPAMVSELNSFQIPRVHIGKNRECGCDMICYLDYEEAAYRLIHHLSGLGHRSIVLLYDSREEAITSEFEAGLHRVSRELQRSIRFSASVGDNSAQGGYLAVQKMIQKKDLPDVLVTAGDLQAIGALKAARDANIRIPGDLALASLNDSPVCSVVSPAITCVEMPATKLGMASARLLFDRIEDEHCDLGVAQEMILQPALKIRESCGNKTSIFELFE